MLRVNVKPIFERNFLLLRDGRRERGGELLTPRTMPRSGADADPQEIDEISSSRGWCNFFSEVMSLCVLI